MFIFVLASIPMTNMGPNVSVYMFTKLYRLNDSMRLFSCIHGTLWLRNLDASNRAAEETQGGAAQEAAIDLVFKEQKLIKRNPW